MIDPTQEPTAPAPAGPEITPDDLDLDRDEKLILAAMAAGAHDLSFGRTDGLNEILDEWVEIERMKDAGIDD